MNEQNFNREIRTPLVIWAILIFSMFVLGLVLRGAWMNGKASVEQQILAYDKTRSVAKFAKILDGNETDMAFKGLMIPESTSAIINAQLLASISKLAGNHGVDILRSNDLLPMTEGTLKLVGGAYEINGTMPNVYAFIADIERAKPVLFIDTLSVRSNGAQNNEAISETTITGSIEISVVVDTPSELPPKTVQP
jgi:Type II secretion system (T2SS), protein M subtype b